MRHLICLLALSALLISSTLSQNWEEGDESGEAESEHGQEDEHRDEDGAVEDADTREHGGDDSSNNGKPAVHPEPIIAVDPGPPVTEAPVEKPEVHPEPIIAVDPGPPVTEAPVEKPEVYESATEEPAKTPEKEVPGDDEKPAEDKVEEPKENSGDWKVIETTEDDLVWTEEGDRDDDGKVIPTESVTDDPTTKAPISDEADKDTDNAEPVYIGCFVDRHPVRDLNGKYAGPPIQPRLTIKWCQEFCRGFNYFGLQASGHCFCGLQYGRYGSKRPESECKHKCTGNLAQICGGVGRNSIYLQAKSYRKATNYLGCYRDRPQRDLTGKYSAVQVVQSIGWCQKFCKGYKYFGLQYSSHCFCSNNFGRYGLGNVMDCRMPCIGKRDQVCGGPWRNSVYRNDDVEAHNYVGCFKDNAARAMVGKYSGAQGAAMTLQWCQDFCQGFKYYGTQYFEHCFCGNEYNKLGEGQVTDCRTPCRGNRQEICGGPWRNSVYRNPQASTDTNYVGCYKDAIPRSVNGKYIGDAKMTLKKCENFCVGFKYFAVQFHSHCFCGDAYTKYGIAHVTDCHTRCSGNLQQVCGGLARNSVYRHPAPSGNRDYLGCFIDRPQRDLNGKWSRWQPKLTVNWCRQFCRGFKFFGLQYSGHCFCGNTHGRYKETIYPRECGMKCTGSNDQVCGGVWRNSVYRV